jgi:hypothetical protein
LLTFNGRALRALASRKRLVPGLAWLATGFTTFAVFRRMVYASLHAGVVSPGLLDSLLRTNLVQALLFFSVVYLPVTIALSNAFAADGRGFTVSRQEYRSHGAVLFPLWGTLMMIAAPVQSLAPQFLVFGVLFGISIGLMALIFATFIYSVWAVRELNFIPAPAAVAVVVLASMTLPMFYLVTAVFSALPLFLMIPLIYLFLQKFRTVSLGRERDRRFRLHLQVLTANPQDADAHRQLALVQMERGNFEAARTHVESALRIQPGDPEYHYLLGRIFEQQHEWTSALQCYEETYRIDPHYGTGDIFREVGKAYLHTGSVEKAAEFLKFFLSNRDSDPEGRYWLALALQRMGSTEEMRVQLNTILEQARSNPAFFRRDKREWIFRARQLLRLGRQPA